MINLYKNQLEEMSIGIIGIKDRKESNLWFLRITKFTKF